MRAIVVGDATEIIGVKSMREAMSGASKRARPAAGE